MSKQKSFGSLSDLGGLVYSTDPDFRPPAPADTAQEMPPEKQVLRIWLERIKGGKEATVIKGFSGPQERLEELAKLLKNKCASGGNAKDGIILVQGDHRDKVLKLLLDLGYKQTKKAGG
ncbi:MAG TPA: translation initiation factor [Saprospiraceae bacterium]|nr:translation initiation factor [Saprospiraceae bacterium]